MRSLFLKIFFSFWVIIVLVGLVMYFVARNNRFKQDHNGFQHLGLQAAEKYGEDAVDALRQGGATGLQDYVTTVAQQSGIRIFLFAGQDGPLTGQTLPEKGREALIAILAGQDLIGEPHSPDGKWLGKILQLPHTPPYIVLINLPAYPPPPFKEEWQGIGFHFLIFLVVGGLICLYLARSLTAPIRRLREATRCIAKGDFSTRIGERLGRKGDEIADLGRDFDMMAERIEELIKAQKRLQRDISHELRSPLARLNVALALARQRSGSEIEQPLARIEKEAERLNELIGQLLTLTALETGAEKPAMEPVKLHHLVSKVAEDADFEARGQQKSVRIIHSQKATVRGARELLHRALENVVRNAVLYTEEKTEVEISLTVKEEGKKAQAIIKIRDHGPGVPEECLEHLSKPFYRVEEARDRQSGGKGIGLAIAEQAIRLHHGTMIAANAEDGGLVMEICLPLQEPVSPLHSDRFLPDSLCNTSA